jgi:orotate phosphoribosyltransferase
MKNSRKHLRDLIQERCLTTGPEFTLSTGEKSRFYFDLKAITLNAEGLTLIADELLEEIREMPVTPTAIGGLTMGADFMTAAVAMRSYQSDGPISDGSIVRKEAKKHGTQNKIENELRSGTKIVVVDDVITTGKSTLTACDEFQKAGYEIVGILAIVDREAGGRKTLEDRFGYVRALFQKRDFPIPDQSGVAANESTQPEFAGIK